MSPEEAWRKVRAMGHSVVIVYICFGLIVAFLFWNQDRESDAKAKEIVERAHVDLVNRCVGAVPTRQALRDQAQAIYKLNIGFIDARKNYTREELAQIRIFVDKVTKFRDRQFRLIHPTKQCAPYVKDDNVKPPVSPTPIPSPPQND